MISNPTADNNATKVGFRIETHQNNLRKREKW
jgi:hypothetical protein